MSRGLCILMVSIMTLLCGCARRNADELMQQAYQAAQRGDLSEAETLSSECLKVNASHIQARLLNDYCKFCRQTHASDRKQALYDLAKCTVLKPDDLECWYYYGWALVQNGQYGEAITPLKRAQALLPPKGGPRPKIQLLLGCCYARNNLQAQALASLQPLQARAPYRNWPELYNNLGLLELRRKQYGNAARFLQEGLNRSPGNDVLLRNLAVVYDVYIDDPVQARHYYLECLKRAVVRGDAGTQQLLQQRLRLVGRRIGKK